MICRHEFRLKVEAFLDIPESLYRRINKKTIRGASVQLDGVNWPRAHKYCRKCGARNVIGWNV